LEPDLADIAPGQKDRLDHPVHCRDRLGQKANPGNLADKATRDHRDQLDRKDYRVTMARMANRETKVKMVMILYWEHKVPEVLPVHLEPRKRFLIP
jgi:hypothetical protein